MWHQLRGQSQRQRQRSKKETDKRKIDEIFVLRVYVSFGVFESTLLFEATFLCRSAISTCAGARRMAIDILACLAFPWVAT